VVTRKNVRKHEGGGFLDENTERIAMRSDAHLKKASSEIDIEIDIAKQCIDIALVRFPDRCERLAARTARTRPVRAREPHPPVPVRTNRTRPARAW
jgi:hypothetical protein